jgi:predicted transcriptional regulator
LDKGWEVNMNTAKEQVIKLLKTMPDDATVDDVLEELNFKLRVDEGLAELDRGESISQEEVERRLAKWLSP